MMGGGASPEPQVGVDGIDGCLDLEPGRETQLIRVALPDGVAAPLDEPRVLVGRMACRHDDLRAFVGGRSGRLRRCDIAGESRGLPVVGRESPHAPGGVVEGDEALDAQPQLLRDVGLHLGDGGSRAGSGVLIAEPAHPAPQEPSGLVAGGVGAGDRDRPHGSLIALDDARSDPAPAGRRAGSGIQPEGVLETGESREIDGLGVDPIRQGHSDERIGHSPRLEPPPHP